MGFIEGIASSFAKGLPQFDKTEDIGLLYPPAHSIGKHQNGQSGSARHLRWDVLIGKELHVWQPSNVLLKDALIHCHDVGSVLVRRLNVLGLELGVVVYDSFLAHPRSELPENALDRQPCPFEDKRLHVGQAPLKRQS